MIDFDLPIIAVFGLFGIDDVIIAVVLAVVSVATTVLSIVLAPTPQKPKAATFDDIQAPTAEDGRAIPVLFGRSLIKSPNCVWYGGFSSLEAESGGQTVGWYYFMTMHLVICHGPVDKLYRFVVNERLAWAGEATGNGSFAVAATELFGGKRSEGGVGGFVDVLFGGPLQGQNLSLLYHLGPDVPAFRGVLSLVLHGPITGDDTIYDGFYFGTTHYIKPWYIDAMRLPARGWYDAKIEVGGQANPAHILYEVHSNPDYGMGYPTSVIDDANYREAADTLHAEGFGLGFLWDRQSSINEFRQQIADHIGAALRYNRSTAKFQIKLIRDDYAVESLPVFDESNILELESFQRVALGDTVNEVVLKYRDPYSGKDKSVVVHNNANWQAQGRIVSMTMTMPGICSDQIALRVAHRELRARSSCFAALRFKANRAAFALQAGDVFVWQWAALGVEQMVMRVGAVRGGTLTDSAITVGAAEDVFGLADSIFSEADPEAWADPNVYGYGLNYGRFYGGVSGGSAFP